MQQSPLPQEGVCVPVERKKKRPARVDMLIHHVHSFDATTLHVLVAAIHNLKGPILSAIEDLKTAVEASNAQTATDLSALNVALSDEMRRITAALAALPNQDAAIIAVTEQVQTMQATLHAGLTAAVDSLNAELPDSQPTV